MKRKMDLLERAHGLLCNTPGDGGSAEEGEAWRKLRAEWIDRYVHVIKDQQVKEHNHRVGIGNEAITAYQEQVSQPTSKIYVTNTPPVDGVS